MTNSSFRRTLAVALSAMALSAILATPAHAQGSRWTAWLGCWSPSPAGLSQVEVDNLPTVCISPTSNADAVEIATVAAGKIAMRDTLNASGVASAIKTADCSGSKSARWSGDERRVYVSSTYSCGSTQTKVSSILAMSERGEWLDLRGVSAGDAQNVRVARYQPVAIPAAVRAEMPAALQDNLFLAQSARMAAGAKVGTNAVIEATKNADASVVEAWLLERGQVFSLDAATLISLADAGIPDVVTDALVAVSNPKAFQIARADAGSMVTEDRVTGRRIIVMAEPMCRSSLSSSYYPYSYGASAFDDYGRYGCGGYGYRGYSAYDGYGRGYGGYYGGYGYPAVIVYPGQSQPVNVGNPRAVKGRGYTQGTGTSTSDNNGSNTRSAQPSSSSSGSSSSSSGASTSSSNAPASQPAPARTAKPRDP